MRIHYVSPISQVGPVNPRGDVEQSHVNDVPYTKQLPPFLHGLEMHGLGALKKETKSKLRDYYNDMYIIII